METTNLSNFEAPVAAQARESLEQDAEDGVKEVPHCAFCDGTVWVAVEDDEDQMFKTREAALERAQFLDDNLPCGQCGCRETVELFGDDDRGVNVCAECGNDQ